MTRSVMLSVIIGFAFNYWQPAWADVDDDILRGVENKLGQIKEVNHKPDFESWIKSANEIDNLIKKKCSSSILSKGLSKNCKKLRDKFIEKSKLVLEKYRALEELSYSDFTDANKLEQKALKIFSYGRTQDEKQEETKHSHLTPVAHQDCDKPNLPFNIKEMEVCWPQEAKDVFGLVMDYASNDLELHSFKECAQLDQNKLGQLNIRFSDKMKKTIIAILGQQPPVEDLLSDFDGRRESSKLVQVGKEPVKVQSAKSALSAHIQAHPSHRIEKNWEDVKGCFSKFKASQVAGRGIRGIDLDFGDIPYDYFISGNTFTGELAVDILEQYFISKNLKTITIRGLAGKTVERFFDLLTHKQVQLDFLRINSSTVYREGEIINELNKLVDPLLKGRLVVKELSLMGPQHWQFMDGYTKDLVQLMTNPNIHLEGLEIILEPMLNHGVYAGVGNVIKKNNTLKSIRVVEGTQPAYSPDNPEPFIEGLKENHSIRSVEFDLQRLENSHSHRVQGILNVFSNVLNMNGTLTNLRVEFHIWHHDRIDTIAGYRGDYVLRVYNGKLLGTEDANGHKQFTSLEAFPVEMRPVIHDILIKLNRNAQIALKKDRGEKVSEDKGSLEEKEEKKSEEVKPPHSSKKSIHGLDE